VNPRITHIGKFARRLKKLFFLVQGPSAAKKIKRGAHPEFSLLGGTT